MNIYSIFSGGNVKPQTHEKRIIRQYLIQTGRIHRFQLKKNINKESFQNIKTIQEFDRYVQTRKLFGEIFINLDMEEQVWYHCELIFGNDAWISKDESGIYRYFSKIHFGGTIGLNIFDVIEILYCDEKENGDAFQNARNRLAKIAGLEDLRDEWRVQQFEKYQNNLMYIRGGRAELEQEYPEVFQFIQRYRPILEYMNSHKEEGLFRVFSYQGEHIFFASTYRLKEKLGISQSTASRSVNMLTLIGMIEKIPHDKLPVQLLGISSRILEHRASKGYKGGKRITLYGVPEYNKETLESAEEVVKKLQDAGSWGSLITKEKVIKFFGEAKAKEVFLADYVIKEVDIAASEDESDMQIDKEWANGYDYIPF
ncbi:hypothetical protein SD70_24915 [Gordoniibacillus kamchatkensis]|uniref:MarR family transcriptional regulator n=1 Tax=Gordoniibacillus kamchatkensis TaxID=1590651 RepID=A0ABR5ACR0_9BACL|nr:hypothetical protein [Paenibacillus sp. VKM B-2647]KIL38692.1 hypothetical protein SD70_24915 [Paenibacillus sp. VKM B-2647]